MMHVKCTGPEPHVNKIDIEAALKPKVVYRSGPKEHPVPERLVIPCSECTHTIVITKQMVEIYRNAQKNP